MDVRTLSKDNVNGKAVTTSEYASHDAADKLDAYPDMDIDTTYSYQKKSSDNSTDLASARMSTDSAAYKYGSRNSESEINEPQYDSESLFDFPPLPVTNLFQKNGDDKRESKKHGDRTSVSEVDKENKFRTFGAMKSKSTNGCTATVLFTHPGNAVQPAFKGFFLVSV
ncbi:hypothetical protein B296_00048452 [Ensete ventricosum]|uniref:Uncharacterized protein n=1 Tax=Ensete ventricosum TaxID=4639 RepID=A0A426Y569_ENSVE|nr:hypothetical protein B296_00048452 [Ensete ventricosum]